MIFIILSFSNWENYYIFFHTLLVFSQIYYNLSNLYAFLLLIKISVIMAVDESVILTIILDLKMFTPIKPMKTFIFKSHFLVIRTIFMDLGLFINDPILLTICVELS